ncbi:MAG: hypothetical protein QGG36_05480 [Pirellulaceae bacterium]|jgi:hypothetical protein|nr:hypothetical protein [Pirellulaceae bacterium]MDP7015226.1 hypothetical protein [Pirellulaceae bacterium]
MARHRLVAIGDSLTQGFTSGAIFRTGLSYPALVSRAMGDDPFVTPNFDGGGGLPLNLEMILEKLSARFGPHISWYNVPHMIYRLQRMMQATEHYWEKGGGVQPFPQRLINHNLAVWGFEVRDAYTVSEGVCRRSLSPPSNDWVAQVPEMAMYRTARRVLNPSFSMGAVEWSQLATARELSNDGGLENLLVALGANNALGTVTSLNVVFSTDQDLHRMPHERECTLYLPEHFETLYRRLVEEIESVGAQRVFLGTIPSVTIPPVTRGVSPDRTQDDDGYYEFYTRPWVWDDQFDQHKHPSITRDQARQIDDFIKSYNGVIRDAAASRDNWHVVDFGATLDRLAFRRHQGNPPGDVPAGLIAALRRHRKLNYLVDPRGRLRLDTRYVSCSPSRPERIAQGGLFSLDGIHPTTIGYGLMADLLFKAMKSAKVRMARGAQLDWDEIVGQDNLISQPPSLLSDLKRLMRFLDKRAVLSQILSQFG